MGAYENAPDNSVQNVEPIACVPVQATDPLYVLFTSGTTLMPKGVVWNNDGHAILEETTQDLKDLGYPA